MQIFSIRTFFISILIVASIYFAAIFLYPEAVKSEDVAIGSPQMLRVDSAPSVLEGNEEVERERENIRAKARAELDRLKSMGEEVVRKASIDIAKLVEAKSEPKLILAPDSSTRLLNILEIMVPCFVFVGFLAFVILYFNSKDVCTNSLKVPETTCVSHWKSWVRIYWRRFIWKVRRIFRTGTTMGTGRVVVREDGYDVIARGDGSQNIKIASSFYRAL